MIRWVVTGPAGAGKSLFTAALADLGATVLDGDTLGHEVLARPEVAAAVAAAFGSDTVRDGRVDRAVLGPLVFGDPESLAQLNALVLPPLAAHMTRRLEDLERDGCVLAVLEAAVYFLLPTPPAVDLVVAVLAGDHVRQARLEAKGLAPRAAADRLAAQAFMAALWSRADLVVENEGEPADLARAARDLWLRRGPDGQNEEMGT